MNLQKYKILDGSMLKLIAVISMAVDHTALILSPVLPFMEIPFFTIFGKELTLYYIMRKIGRLAFPIFCFLITEGCVHTRSRKKYGLRLLLFAVLSETPFNLMSGGDWLCFSKQNIYFTLLMGLLLISMYDNILGEGKRFVAMLMVLAGAMLLHVDYGVRGVCLILLMYILRNQAAARAIISYPLLSGGNAAFLAFIPIGLYNGRRGFIRSPLVTYGFYLFYPVHILLLPLLRQVLHQ